MLALARHHQHPVALMFIDLDGFKAVNDTHGHAAGDQLLQNVAGRIQGCLREGDLLFRMGGDEFTAVLARVVSADEAEDVARRVLAAVAQPVAVAKAAAGQPVDRPPAHAVS